MISSDLLDLKKTIEATLKNAKGWFLASYPSQKDPCKKIQIIVNYPQNDINKQPESVCIFRGNTCITVGKSFVYNAQNKKEPAYMFNIHVSSGLNFSINKSPLWGQQENGVPALFDALQKDSELSQYIPLIPKGKPITSQKPKWDLNKIMRRSRA